MSQVRKDVLNGWKEIAAYLGRDPRTVERWEKQRSLPVRRLPGSGRATVYALVAELDAWLARPLPETLPQTIAEQAQTASVPRAPADGKKDEAVERTERTAVVEPAGKPTPARRSDLRWISWKTSLVAAVLLLGCVLFMVERRDSRPTVNKGIAVPDPSSPPGERISSLPAPGVENLYLRGAYEAELRTPDSLRRAQQDFSAVIANDPGNAPAFAGLASVYVLLREYSLFPDSQAYAQARAAATRAIELNPKLPQAHAVLGFVDFFWLWDRPAAEREFQTALQLEPHLALAHHWYGSMLMHEGAFQHGLQELDTAQRLEPSSFAILSTRAYALGLSGRRDEAVDLLTRALVLQETGQYRNPATTHHVLSVLCLLPPADIRRSLSETILASQLRQNTSMVLTLRHATQVYRARGEQAMWHALLADEEQRHRRDGPTYAMARYEASLGQGEQALNDLNSLLLRHDPALIGISMDPLFLPLRHSSRFQHIRSAMGLPKADWE